MRVTDSQKKTQVSANTKYLVCWYCSCMFIITIVAYICLLQSLDSSHTVLPTLVADEPEYLAEDAWDAHERRLEAIDELLPLKYRYPHYYRPRSTSVPPMPRSSSLPPTALRALSRARSTTPAPPHLRDIIEEKTPDNSLYSYTGNILPDESFPCSSTTFYSYAGNVLSSYLTTYLVYKHMHYYNNPRSILWNMRHNVASALIYH